MSSTYSSGSVDVSTTVYEHLHYIYETSRNRVVKWCTAVLWNEKGKKTEIKERTDWSQEYESCIRDLNIVWSEVKSSQVKSS